MPVYHIVLLKLKPSATAAQIESFKSAAESMVGKIPGLTKLDVGPPLESTKHRAQGYGLGLVALLEREEDVAVYGAHPAHQPVNDIRLEIAEETLAFDTVY